MIKNMTSDKLINIVEDDAYTIFEILLISNLKYLIFLKIWLKTIKHLIKIIHIGKLL